MKITATNNSQVVAYQIDSTNLSPEKRYYGNCDGPNCHRPSDAEGLVHRVTLLLVDGSEMPGQLCRRCVAKVSE